MSRKICVQFEIRNMLIMRDTLKQMGMNYDEINEDQIEIRRNWNNIIMNSQTGQISYDEVNVNEVNSIKQNYMTNWYKDQAIREGMNLQEERNNLGQVVLHLYQK